MGQFRCEGFQSPAQQFAVGPGGQVLQIYVGARLFVPGKAIGCK